MASWFFCPMVVIGRFICSTVVAGWFSLPKGSCQVIPHTRCVTSSIMGPWGGVCWPGLLRATLPTEVVTMSMYVMPVISSLMMRLVLMVANLGTVTTPMATKLEDALGALSGDSSLFNQAVTHRKLQVGVTLPLSSF